MGRVAPGSVGEPQLLHVNPQPLFVLSRTGELLYANPAGQALLAQGDWIDVRTGKLARLGQLEAVEVSASLARAQLGQIQTHSLLRMRTDSLRASATARFVPLGIDNPARWVWPRAATLLTIDEGHDDHQLRRIAQIGMQFKLTSAETRLLGALADGETPGSVAERQAISVHTVRTHLSNIFGKTGLRRQADLIRLVTQ
ncbi:helix-turn-helix transcriptional regulator [Variovorax sp. DAIF25]|uniref:helix-turn-helix transcriptional regulator n=1 Tax=Variovorax sp. DAIF25 TaxID=3080983 RepID=UPI003D6B8EAD